MTPMLTQSNSRSTVGMATFILSLFLVAIVAQKLELQRVQSERDMAVTRAREFKLAFEQEHKKRTLQYMLLQSVSDEKASAAKKKTDHAIPVDAPAVASVAEPVALEATQIVAEEPQLAP